MLDNLESTCPALTATVSLFLTFFLKQLMMLVHVFCFKPGQGAGADFVCAAAVTSTERGVSFWGKEGNAWKSHQLFVQKKKMLLFLFLLFSPLVMLGFNFQMGGAGGKGGGVETSGWIEWGFWGRGVGGGGEVRLPTFLSTISLPDYLPVCAHPSVSVPVYLPTLPAYISA